MGNNESKHYEPISFPASPHVMGHQPAPRPAPIPTSPMARQHERLIFELFPFKTTAQFHTWLSGPLVAGSWAEFYGDCRSAASDVDKNAIAQKARDAIDKRNSKFLVYHPEKKGWTHEDHVLRFIVTVVQDNLLAETWSSDLDWRRKPLDICKSVFELLCFLRLEETSPPAAGRSVWEAGPPGYTPTASSGRLTPPSG